MRLALIIILLTVIAVGLVHIRSSELRAAGEIQRIEIRQVKLRRKLWDQQGRIDRLKTPKDILRRMETMPSVNLVGADEAPRLPERDGGSTVISRR